VTDRRVVACFALTRSERCPPELIRSPSPLVLTAVYFRTFWGTYQLNLRRLGVLKGGSPAMGPIQCTARPIYERDFQFEQIRFGQLSLTLTVEFGLIGSTKSSQCTFP
jgi:hypothetical protein